MFKLINNFLINPNCITKIEDVGVDPKDNKPYCRIFLIGGDPSGICVEGTLNEIQLLLSS